AHPASTPAPPRHGCPARPATGDRAARSPPRPRQTPARRPAAMSPSRAAPGPWEACHAAYPSTSTPVPGGKPRRTARDGGGAGTRRAAPSASAARQRTPPPCSAPPVDSIAPPSRPPVGRRSPAVLQCEPPSTGPVVGLAEEDRRTRGSSDPPL